MPKMSYAEEKGMSFKTRCEEALAALRRYWVFQQCHVSTSELLQLESIEGKERLRDLFNGRSRQGLSGLMTHPDKIIAQASAEFLKRFWDDALQVTRNVYGCDATEFAVKALMAEKKPN